MKTRQVSERSMQRSNMQSRAQILNLGFHLHPRLQRLLSHEPPLYQKPMLPEERCLGRRDSGAAVALELLRVHDWIAASPAG